MNGNCTNARSNPEEVHTESVSAVEQPAFPRGWETILLVEDEAFVREVTCEVLESAGYLVLKTGNAAEAVQAFAEYGDAVQLLLTDMIMPGKNGRELARELRAMCPCMKTIVASGYPEHGIPRGQTDEPGVFYLPKPFSAESLLRRVRQALDEKGLPVADERTAKHAACSR